MLKKCNHPGCPTVFEGKGYLCEAHRNRFYDPSESEKKEQRNGTFYRSTAWIGISKRWRAKHTICEACGRNISNHVDHHLELSLDPRHKFARSTNNLVALCYSCHISKGHDIRRLINRGNINAIRRYLIENHPRPECVDYLKDCEIQISES